MMAVGLSFRFSTIHCLSNTFSAMFFGEWFLISSAPVQFSFYHDSGQVYSQRDTWLNEGKGIPYLVSLAGWLLATALIDLVRS